MTKEQRNQMITAVLASAFLHHKRLMEDPKADVPGPRECRAAYINDPMIAALTDAAVCGVLAVLEL